MTVSPRHENDSVAVDWQSRGVRFVTWLAGGVWIGSWYLMYLEVTRWHHVRPSLAFNYDIAPGARPGQPLVLLYVASVAAPLVVGRRGIIHLRGRRDAG